MRCLIWQRCGQRPLRRMARPVLRETWCLGTPGAHVTLGLYEAAPGYVCEMICQPGAASGAPAWHEAVAVPSLDAAVACLEAARPPMVPPALRGDGASAVLQDATRRFCADHALRCAFSFAVGALLHALCADPLRARLMAPGE